MRYESGDEGARKLKKWHGLLARSRGSFELHCSKATKPWREESGVKGGTKKEECGMDSDPVVEEALNDIVRRLRNR